MALILNEYFDLFIVKFGESEKQYFFSKGTHRFSSTADAYSDDRDTIKLPHFSEEDLFKEYLSIRGIRFAGIDKCTAPKECRIKYLECAAEYGYDDEMEDYVRNRVLNLMLAWIRKYEIENVKVVYNKYDIRQERLSRLSERGPYIMTNEIMKRLKEFKAAQIQGEAIDETAYLNFINNK